MFHPTPLGITVFPPPSSLPQTKASPLDWLRRDFDQTPSPEVEKARHSLVNKVDEITQGEGLGDRKRAHNCHCRYIPVTAPEIRWRWVASLTISVTSNRNMLGCWKVFCVLSVSVCVLLKFMVGWSFVVGKSGVVYRFDCPLFIFHSLFLLVIHVSPHYLSLAPLSLFSFPLWLESFMFPSRISPTRHLSPLTDDTFRIFRHRRETQSSFKCTNEKGGW